MVVTHLSSLLLAHNNRISSLCVTDSWKFVPSRNSVEFSLGLGSIARKELHSHIRNVVLPVLEHRNNFLSACIALFFEHRTTLAVGLYRRLIIDCMDLKYIILKDCDHLWSIVLNLKASWFASLGDHLHCQMSPVSSKLMMLQRLRGLTGGHRPVLSPYLRGRDFVACSTEVAKVSLFLSLLLE